MGPSEDDSAAEVERGREARRRRSRMRSMTVGRAWEARWDRHKDVACSLRRAGARRWVCAVGGAGEPESMSVPFLGWVENGRTWRARGDEGGMFW
jgi:hypothetical protein